MSSIKEEIDALLNEYDKRLSAIQTEYSKKLTEIESTIRNRPNKYVTDLDIMTGYCNDSTCWSYYRLGYSDGTSKSGRMDGRW